MADFDDNDLYGDLYNDAEEGVEQEPSHTEQQPAAGAPAASESAAPAAPVASFIPGAAPPSATPSYGSAPRQQSYNQSYTAPAYGSTPASASNGGGSFIPGPTPNAPHTSADDAGGYGSPDVSGGQNRSYASQSSAPLSKLPFSSTSSSYGGPSAGGATPAALGRRPGGVQPHEMPDEGKMFVGGLNWETTEDSLKNYMSQFGKVNHCVVMRTAEGTSRGFGFLSFADPKAVNTVMVREHILDGKIIDPKRAIPRPEQAEGGQQKLFIGGIPPSATSESYREFFEQRGPVSEAKLMMDIETGRHRGFGFITFVSDADSNRAIAEQPLYMDGKAMEVKKAQPRGARIEPTPRVGGLRNGTSVASGGMNSGGGMGGGMGAAAVGGGGAVGGMGMGGGFDPNAMARLWQTVMSQNQQGGAFNPMMGMMGGMGAMNPMMMGMQGGMMGMGAQGIMGGGAGMGRGAMMGGGGGGAYGMGRGAGAGGYGQQQQQPYRAGGGGASYGGGGGGGGQQQSYGGASNSPSSLPQRPGGLPPRPQVSRRSNSPGRGDRARSPPRRD